MHQWQVAQGKRNDIYILILPRLKPLLRDHGIICFCWGVHAESDECAFFFAHVKGAPLVRPEMLRKKKIVHRKVVHFHDFEFGA
jgi:hypothetical protein